MKLTGNDIINEVVTELYYNTDIDDGNKWLEDNNLKWSDDGQLINIEM